MEKSKVGFILTISMPIAYASMRYKSVPVLDANFLRGVHTSVQGLFCSVRAVYSNVGQVYGARVQRRRTSVRGTCTTTLDKCTGHVYNDVGQVYGARVQQRSDMCMGNV